MSKIIKVVVKYDDKIYIAEGEDAKRWVARVHAMETLYFSHYGKKDFNWTRIEEKADDEKNN